MGEWIMPLMKRGRSGTCDLNFLWRSERLYVMDNHRAALWCWLQHLPEAPKWQLLHIDRHYDTLRSQLDEWLELMPDNSVSLSEHLGLKQTIDGTECPVIRWDNYLSIFLARHGDRVPLALFATAQEGDKPHHPNWLDVDPWTVMDHLERIAEDEDEVWSEPPWIVNIDMDYFTARRGAGAEQFRMFDDEYIACMGAYVAVGLRRGRIACATLALSPETTGGWPLAERLTATFLSDWNDVPVLRPS